MESTALSKVREYSPEELATIEKCGSVGFSYKELALILAVPELEIQEEFEKKAGKLYQAWMKGRMQTELSLRLEILKDALGGSSQMINQMTDILHRTDEEINKLLY